MLADPRANRVAEFIDATYAATPASILLLELVHREDKIGKKIKKDIDVARYVQYLDERHNLDFSKPFTKRFLDDPWYTGVSDD